MEREFDGLSMPTVKDKKIHLGILGGGQLGLMMIESAGSLPLDFHVLDPDPDAPCATVAAHSKRGDFRDFATVMEFGKGLDVLTIEIENVNVQALKRLRDEQGVRVFPQPEVMELVQDKGDQKQFLKRHRIPTADFVLIDSASDLAVQADFLPAFQKLRKSGYDGRGVCRLDSLGDLPKAFDAPSVLEKSVEIKKEISVLLARSREGQIKLFPIVEMRFHPTRHLVDLLFAPASLSPDLVDRAYQIAREVAQALNIVGVLAVEMFVTPDNKILVNEIAPRPHNSGHHTIEANETSQYLIHLQSILGLELGSTRLNFPSALLNLLGEDGFSGDVVYEGLEHLGNDPKVFVHVYGKKQTRAFRKMGHVTVLADTVEAALKKIEAIKKEVRVVA